MKFLEMTSLVDSGGVDCFGSGVEIETLEKDPVDQHWNGSDFQNTNPCSNAFVQEQLSEGEKQPAETRLFSQKSWSADMKSYNSGSKSGSNSS